jgi:beta-glucosidase
MAEIVAEEGGESLRDAAEEVLENSFLRATEGDDFVGVQCYTRMHFGPDGQAPNDPSVPVTQMDDERWPRAVEFCVRRAAAISGRPVVVTENGIATADDTDRIAFLAEAIASAHRCLEEGIDLRGYFVWSLLDNFEWHLGYGPQFGIVSVAAGTFERRPKPSAYWFGEVAQANALVTAPAQGVPRG